jgi:hypothetical protein
MPFAVMVVTTYGALARAANPAKANPPRRSLLIRVLPTILFT